MILGDLVTSIGAGTKEGIIGGVSGRKEEGGEAKRGRIVSGTMNNFLSQPMYKSNNQNRYGTHPFLASQINQPNALLDTGIVEGSSLTHFSRASFDFLNKSPIPLPNCPIISLRSPSIPSFGIPSIRLSLSSLI